jgi:hypothetical protein
LTGVLAGVSLLCCLQTHEQAAPSENNAGSPAEIAPKIGGCAAICQAFNGRRNLPENAYGGHAVSRLP